MKNNGKTPEIRFDGFVGEWDVDILNELAEVKDSARISNKYWTQKGVPYVRASDISNNDLTGVLYLSQETYEEYKKITGAPIQGDVLFNGGGEIGRAVLKKDETPLYVQGGAVLYVKTSSSKTLNGQYLATFFETNLSHSYIEVASVGGTMKHFTLKPAQQMPVPFPSLAEQKQIGAFFERLDALIALYRRRRDNLANVKKSLLEKMFPRDGAKVPEIRFDGFVGEWETRRLSEITTLHARIGWQNLRKSEFLDTGDYYLITGTDFVDGQVDLAHCHYVSRERYEQDPNIKAENGSILITKDGTLGKVALLNNLDKPATLNAGVFNVVIKDKKEVNNLYLYHYLKGPFLLNYIYQKATGGTIKHLNQGILVDFPVILTSYTEQLQIGMFFQELDALIALSSRLLEKIQNVKKSFLSKAFVSS